MVVSIAVVRRRAARRAGAPAHSALPQAAPAGICARPTFASRSPPSSRSLIGFLAGPVSAVLLRNWEPLRTFHGAVGLVAAALFAAAAVLGLRLERGRSRRYDAHALLGLLAMLAGVIAGVAGFVLLP